MSTNPVLNKTAFVTGASRGIGAATALALARLGISPILAVRDPAAAEGVAQAVTELGVACRIETCDVADYASVAQAVQRTLQAWGRLDIVINNAGQIDPVGHLGDTEPDAWARAISVNLVGSYNVIHACLPTLNAHGAGAIVNVSTGAAHNPQEGWSAYCSAKAGAAMLTRCVAHEYTERGIVVFGLQPGLIDTDMQGRIRGSGMNPISRVPRAELGSPERPAQVIAWLADTRPIDLNGQDLTLKDQALMARVTTVQP